MARLFISHSSADNAAAIAIGDWLREQGFDDIFLDIDPERGLVAGDRWQEALKAAADRCEAVLFMVSHAWLASRWCLAEFLLAKTLHKRIFGLIIESVPTEELPVEMTAEWQICELVGVDRLRSFTVQGRGGPARIDFREAGLDLLRRGLERAGLEARSFPWPPANDPQRGPYRGLKVLEAVDAAVFFGREAQIVRGMDQVRGLAEGGVGALLVILGASGAGKSSFLRAGLWPRLARDDVNFLPLPVIRPENNVLSGTTGLAAALTAAFASMGEVRNLGDVRRALLGEPDQLAPMLRTLHGLATQRLAVGNLGRANPVLVLPLDQAEELFAPEGAAEAERFIAMLVPLLRGGGSIRLLLLVTIRADRFELLQAAPAFAGIRRELFDLPPMPVGEYKDIINGPAQRASSAGGSLAIAPSLTLRLMDEAQGADALPLLAFTLERLYADYGKAGTLSEAHYDALGGIRGVLDAAVRAALEEPSRRPSIPADPLAQLNTLRATFIPWLARIDLESRQPRRRVAKLAAMPAAAQLMAMRLVAARLLLLDRRNDADLIEIAHESLLRAWPVLRFWLDEDAADLSRLEGVERAAFEWVRNGRNAAWLDHRAGRLEEAERVLARGDFALGGDRPTQEYLESCRARDAAERTARADAATRLLRRTQWGLSVALLLAALAGGLGWQAWRAQRRAEHNFAAATGAVRGLIDELATPLRSHEGITAAAVAKILGIADRVVTGLLRTAPREPRLLELQVSGQTIIADTWLALGSTDQALPAAQAALQGSLNLAARDPQNVVWQRALAQSDIAVGRVLLTKGNFDDALKSFSAALEVMQKLTYRDPGNAAWPRELLSIHGHLGEALTAKGEAIGALQHYRSALAIDAVWNDKDPSDTAWEGDLAASNISVGDVLQARGDQAGALDAYRASLSASGVLLARDASNTTWQHLRVVGLQSFGDVKVAQGDLKSGLAAYRDAERMSARLAGFDAGNADWQNDLLVIRQKVGDVSVSTGDLPRAFTAYRSALVISLELAARDGTNADWQRNVGVLRNKVGDVRLAQGDIGGAAQDYGAAQAIAEAMTAAKPDNNDWLDDAATSSLKLGDVAVAAGDLQMALRHYLDAVGRTKRLTTRDPETTDWQHDLSTSQIGLGDTLLAQGQPAPALAAYRAALSLRAILARKDPVNMGWQLDLAAAQGRLAQALLDEGDGAGALAALQPANTSLMRLVSFDVANTDWRRDQADFKCIEAEALLKQGNASGALSASQAALDIDSDLVARDPSNSVWRTGRATARRLMGDSLLRRGDVQGALAAYRLGLGDVANIGGPATDPVPRQHERELLEARIGAGLAAAGERTGAQAAYGAALALADRLVALDRSNRQWAREQRMAKDGVARGSR